jgi:translocator protein
VLGQLASKGQLRMSFFRWAVVTVPLILFLGFLSGRMSNSGYANRWFDALIKPDWIPPGWVFGVVWTILYCLMGLSIAMILHARGAKGRGAAIAFFAAQLVLNLAWSPLFFAAHQVTFALAIIMLILILAITTAWLFRAIRPVAALLVLPYILWLCVAAALNFEIHRLNPNAETFIPEAPRTEIILE